MQVSGALPISAEVLHQVMCCRDENEMQKILQTVHIQAQMLPQQQAQQQPRPQQPPPQRRILVLFYSQSINQSKLISITFLLQK
jgi:hypothetical protein